MRSDELSGFFSFTRRERVGVFTLTLLCLLAAILPVFLRTETHVPDAAEKEDLARATAGFRARLAHENESGIHQNREVLSGQSPDRQSLPETRFHLFPFDPNTLDDAGWKKLGLPERCIRTIRNYLSKGGKFFRPADLEKIYGLPASDLKRLIPYVEIAGNKPLDTIVKKNIRREWESHKKEDLILDINLADSAAWMALPGIGARLSHRILVFRAKLGGFASIMQVAETYGLADSVYEQIRQYLRNESGIFRKMDLNKAGIEELAAHPYINYSISRAIVNYRRQHGFFQSIEELRNIELLGESDFRKISPYVVVGSPDEKIP